MGSRVQGSGFRVQRFKVSGFRGSEVQRFEVKILDNSRQISEVGAGFTPAQSV
jgi:hypothetical protein